MRGHFNFAKVQRGRNDDVNEGAKSEGGREKLTAAAAAARLLSGLGAWHPLLRHLIRPPYKNTPLPSDALPEEEKASKIEAFAFYECIPRSLSSSRIKMCSCLPTKWRE